MKPKVWYRDGETGRHDCREAGDVELACDWLFCPWCGLKVRTPQARKREKAMAQGRPWNRHFRRMLKVAQEDADVSCGPCTLWFNSLRSRYESLSSLGGLPGTPRPSHYEPIVTILPTRYFLRREEAQV